MRALLARLWRLPQHAALALIWVYQHTLSRVMPPICRFEPSCSEYARQAIVRHGAVKGSLLAARRLCRCQPFCRGGYDPVPPLQDDGHAPTEPRDK